MGVYNTTANERREREGNIYIIHKQKIYGLNWLFFLLFLYRSVEWFWFHCFSSFNNFEAFTRNVRIVRIIVFLLVILK